MELDKKHGHATAQQHERKRDGTKKKKTGKEYGNNA